MKIRIKYAKEGAMKFIGHLDIMRYFQKAIRRAEIPIAYTEGFSPHMIMSFALPLGVGVTSTGDYFDIEVTETLRSADAVARLNAVMADGMQVLSYRQIPEDKANKAMSLVTAADYTVRFRDGYAPAEGWTQKLASFYDRKTIVVLKKTKKSEREVDIKPLIHEFSLIDDNTIFMRVSAGSVDNVKPDLVMNAFAAHLGEELSPYALLINRNELYAEGMCPLADLGEDIGD